MDVEGHGIVGIVTERDVMKKAANLQNEEDKTIVKDIMSNHILCIDPSTTVMEAFATMTKENIRHLAVIRPELKEKVTKGLVPIDAMRSVLSIKDILKEYAKHGADKKFAEAPVDEAVVAEVPAPKESEAPADTKAEAVPAPVTAGSLLRKKHEKIKLILNTRIEDNISVAEAVQEMARRNFGAVLVMDDELHVKGIFTERDYLTKVLHPKLNSHDVLVKDLCSRNVFTLKNDASLETCVHEAAVQNFRHLPVVDNKDDIVGMLSVKDVVREISREHRSTQGFWLMEYFKSKMTDKPTEEKKTEVAEVAKTEAAKPSEPTNAEATENKETTKPSA
ncbi:hypothetical protein THRCLA_01421 [Thraustotheca clavata]|uniref:CBS domain-containing protein n=1 Tax=Thraustotheca clavata TaxID=74557 RepID=A0A1W0A953_9STRA|nr:hypothetical protein THRCLA_01421 [Thraustotheca clavata]